MISPSRQLIAAEAAQPPLFVGVDVGGTAVKIGVVDDLGRSLSWLSVPTEVASGPQAGVRRMAEGVAKAAAQARVLPDQLRGVGLGTPGMLDPVRGILLSPSNLPGWWNFPIRDELSRAVGLPVTYTNDAAAAGYGEFWVGSGRSFQSMVLFTLGTGVGGAIIVGDLSIDGDHGNGAELGHAIIDYNDNARMCTCGQRGHLEAYASATAVVRRTEEMLATGRTSSLTQRLADGAAAGGSIAGGKAPGGTALSPLLVAEEAERGDEAALEIVLDTARYLGIAATNAMHTVDPSGVVIGGAMTFGGPQTELGRRFLARVRQEIQRRAIPLLAERTTVEFASLGGDAGYIGAAGLARLAAQQKS